MKRMRKGSGVASGVGVFAAVAVGSGVGVLVGSGTSVGVFVLAGVGWGSGFAIPGLGGSEEQAAKTRIMIEHNAAFVVSVTMIALLDWTNDTRSLVGDQRCFRCALTAARSGIGGDFMVKKPRPMVDF